MSNHAWAMTERNRHEALPTGVWEHSATIVTSLLMTMMIKQTHGNGVIRNGRKWRNLALFLSIVYIYHAVVLFYGCYTESVSMDHIYAGLVEFVLMMSFVLSRYVVRGQNEFLRPRNHILRHTSHVLFTMLNVFRGCIRN
jgi:hypothetical protein